MQDRARSLNWKSRLYCSHTDHEGILYHVKMTKFATQNKQSTTTSSTHVKKNFQMNTFHDGLKSWIDLYYHRACMSRCYLKYAFSINREIWQSNQGIPWQSLHYLICIITHGLCSYNVWISNDDITAIGVSFWWRREFSNFSQFHRGRMSSPAQVIRTTPEWD